MILLTSSLKTNNTTLNNTHTVPLDDATVILNNVVGLEPTIINLLKTIILNKPNFLMLGFQLGQVIQTDLTNLHVVSLVSQSSVPRYTY